jgi:hypothetical protein
MNALERAVIEAARLVADRAGNLDTWAHALRRAVVDLDEHERAQEAAGLTEVPWAQIAEGDELRGNSGRLFPVVATKREWQMGKPTGKFLITVQLPAGPKVLTRPTPAEPTATVKRGDAGAAVDMFVNVFSSGGLP